MNIKDKFQLISGAPNILDLSKAQVASLTLEGNSPQHLYATLDLKKSMIKHKGFNKIFDYLKSVKTSKDLEILYFEQYPLVASYNRKTNSKVINLFPFNTKELSRVSYLNLYAALLYSYTFDKIVNKNLRIPENMIQPISNFWFSMFVQVFGRDYGMTGTYSSKLPGLKFLITLYILVAFFGKKQDKAAYNLAKSYSGYMYDEKLSILKQSDLSNIHGLARALNAMDVMPGFNIVKYTTKMHRMYDIQMLPAFEDLSRFLTSVMVSSVGGQTIIKTHLNTKNKSAFMLMLNYMEKRLF
jgi:hypothetical protein